MYEKRTIYFIKAPNKLELNQILGDKVFFVLQGN